MRTLIPCLLLALSAPSIASAQSAPPALASHATRRSAALEARVSWVRGEVEVTTGTGASSESHAMRAGEVLAAGSRVHASATGRAELTLVNGAGVELAPNAQMLMFASPTPMAPDQPPSVTTTLLRGTVYLHAAPGNPRARLVPLATGAATVFAGRSEVMFAADLGGHIARIGALRGRVRVRTGAGREYLLRAGSGTTEEFGRPPMPYRQLPAQPVWREAPPTRVISGGDPVSVSGRYGVPGDGVVARWRIQVARDENFRDLITTNRAESAVTTWRDERMAPGTYYLRVTAFDQERFEGLPSATARIVVAAPMVNAAREAGEEGPARVATVSVPDGFLCGLDGARLTEIAAPLRLVPGRTHALRCRLSGTQEVRVMPLSVEQSGPLTHTIRTRSTSFSESLLTVRLQDIEGSAVPYVNLGASGDAGVAIDPLREGDERGVYQAAVHWPSGVTSARVRFAINGGHSFEADITKEQ